MRVFYPQHCTIVKLQSVSINTNVVSSNPLIIQHYVVTFVSDLRQVGGFGPGFLRQ